MQWSVTSIDDAPNFARRSCVASNWRRNESEIDAVMPINVGLLFFWHGISKLFGFPIPAPNESTTVIGTAVGLEFVGGALLMAGFQTRLVSFVCADLTAAA
jgi:uncharacterized membrane protein YphA (DoxX/SURF4 family)